ncbi:hypothetical protein ABH930_002913 [Kitasatospora sp. GAS204A]|nr:hypothetical protein [Kitasatospora sp. GAS204B]
MSARTVLGTVLDRAGVPVRAWLRACTVPEAHARSPLATFPDAALGAARSAPQNLMPAQQEMLPPPTSVPRTPTNLL